MQRHHLVNSRSLCNYDSYIIIDWARPHYSNRRSRLGWMWATPNSIDGRRSVFYITDDFDRLADRLRIELGSQPISVCLKQDWYLSTKLPVVRWNDCANRNSYLLIHDHWYDSKRQFKIGYLDARFLRMDLRIASRRPMWMEHCLKDYRLYVATVQLRHAYLSACKRLIYSQWCQLSTDLRVLGQLWATDDFLQCLPWRIL